MENPQFEPHARIKMAQVLGSPMYICGVTLNNVLLLIVSNCWTVHKFGTWRESLKIGCVYVIVVVVSTIVCLS